MARRPKPPPLPRSARVAAMAERIKERREARAMAGGGASASGETGLDKAWKLNSAVDLLNRTLSTILDWTVPTFTGAIVVSVAGGPHADIRRVWYLALSAAFGRMRNTFESGRRTFFLGGLVPRNFVTHQMAGSWDVTAKACQVEIAYSLSAVDAVLVARAGLPSAGRVGVLVGGRLVFGSIDPTQRPDSYIKRGPEQLTVGGPWPNWLRRGSQPTTRSDPDDWRGAACIPPVAARIPRVTALPRSFADIFREYPQTTPSGFASYPFTVIHPTGITVTDPPGTGQLDVRGEFLLPDANRVITTADKTNPRVQPPAPVLDGRGRSNLLSLVAQSLQAPCFNPTGVPCTAVPNGDSGVFVASRNVDLTPVQLGNALVRNQFAIDDPAEVGELADRRAPQSLDVADRDYRR